MCKGSRVEACCIHPGAVGGCVRRLAGMGGPRDTGGLRSQNVGTAYILHG